MEPAKAMRRVMNAGRSRRLASCSDNSGAHGWSVSNIRQYIARRLQFFLAGQTQLQDRNPDVFPCRDTLLTS